MNENEPPEQPIGKPTNQSYVPKTLLGVIFVLVLCAGAALAFKLVKREPEPDVEAPPVENSDDTPDEGSEETSVTPKPEENAPQDAEKSKQ